MFPVRLTLAAHLATLISNFIKKSFDMRYPPWVILWMNLQHDWYYWWHYKPIDYLYKKRIIEENRKRIAFWTMKRVALTYPSKGVTRGNLFIPTKIIAHVESLQHVAIKEKSDLKVISKFIFQQSTEGGVHLASLPTKLTSKPQNAPCKFF